MVVGSSSVTMPKYNADNMGTSSDSNREDSAEENFDKEILMKKIKYGKRLFLCLKHFE